MPEKRRHFRKPVNMAVELTIANGPRRPGTCHDLSLGGMSIECTALARFNDKVVVHIARTNPGGEIVVEGVVRWNQGSTMGVQFALMGARETYALTELLSR